MLQISSWHRNRFVSSKAIDETYQRITAIKVKRQASNLLLALLILWPLWSHITLHHNHHDHDTPFFGSLQVLTDRAKEWHGRGETANRGMVRRLESKICSEKKVEIKNWMFFFLLENDMSQGRSTPCIGDGKPPTWKIGNPYKGYINP